MLPCLSLQLAKNFAPHCLSSPTVQSRTKGLGTNVTKYPINCLFRHTTPHALLQYNVEVLLRWRNIARRVGSGNGDLLFGCGMFLCKCRETM